MRFFAGSLLFLTTAGCATVTADPYDRRCDAGGLGSLVGRTATEELGADALQRSGARGLRWIRPGDAVTMDYRPDRLNVRLDAQTRIEGFSCG